LYVKPILDKNRKISDYREYQHQFLLKCQNKIEEVTSVEGWGNDETMCATLRRILNSVERIAKQTEVYGLNGDSALSCLCKGEPINLKVENKMVAHWENAKVIDVKLFGNDTVYDLKKKLAAEEKNINWNNLKLTGKESGRDILEVDNGTSLRLLKFKVTERI